MQSRKMRWMLVGICALTLTSVLSSLALARGGVSVMTKEELRAQLGKSNVVVVDVRTGSDWRASEMKIKGAVRVEARQVTSLAERYDKNATVVLYCA